MAISLDRSNEARIQRELSRGHFHNEQEIIAHALDLLDAQEEWLQENRNAIQRKIELSSAQVERGEYLSGAEAKKILSERKRKKH